MRNLSTPSAAAARRGSNAGIGAMLASPNQSRYKGLISTPGMTKFSAWKRENEIPKVYFHDFILQKIRDKQGDKVWIKDVSNGRFEQFGQVQPAVSKIASGLTKIGFGKTDVICMFCSNYVEYWLVALAAWSCGGCVMPVNCELEQEHLEYQLTQAQAKVLVCDDVNIADALDALDNVSSLANVLVIGGGQQSDLCKGCIPVTDLLEDDGKSGPKKLDIDWDNTTVFLPYTSTSSGSKGIEHTHRSLMAAFYSPDGAANHWFDQLIGDSVVCGNWFFHMTGLYSFALASIYGITLYTLSDYTDTNLLDAIVDNRVPSATVYPWQIRMLSQSPDVSRFDLSCLKVLITGGSLLSATIRMEVMERLPSLRYVREAYGLNECGFVTLSYPREKKNSVPGGGKAIEMPDDHVIPVGLPNMYSQIKIINRQTGDPVQGPDEQGEICVKSAQCFKGYVNCNQMTTFDVDGYFHTGDLGYYDNQGMVFFIESIANLIHFWMYEVSPSILESRLLGSNNIVDAAVVGIPDKENGQVPRAFVVLRPGFEETEENLTNLMESRLQDHERIRGGLYFIQSIPRDENWKVRRDLLAEYVPKKSDDCTLNVSAGLPSSKKSSTTDGPAKSPHDDLALRVAESPKLAKKMVKELEKQPNGTFIAPQVEPQEAISPRIQRSAKKVNSPPQESSSGGARPRSRRDSMDCILEDRAVSGAAGLAPAPASTSRRRSSRIPSGTSGSRGSSRRGSTSTDLETSASVDHNQEPFTYWLQVTILPQVLEKVVLSHPAVDDCTVQGFYVEGIGHLPRAYVALKSGYMASTEEILQFVQARVLETDRLRGGVVFVDKLPKDPSGKLFISLDKFDKNAEGLDENFCKQQPKLNLLQE